MSERRVQHHTLGTKTTSSPLQKCPNLSEVRDAFGITLETKTSSSLQVCSNLSELREQTAEYILQEYSNLSELREQKAQHILQECSIQPR